MRAISSAAPAAKSSGEFPELGLVTDVALDPDTSHGHDGLRARPATPILNDETVELLRARR